MFPACIYAQAPPVRHGKMRVRKSRHGVKDGIIAFKLYGELRGVSAATEPRHQPCLDLPIAVAK
jgi:hypothetical protein